MRFEVKHSNSGNREEEGYKSYRCRTIMVRYDELPVQSHMNFGDKELLNWERENKEVINVNTAIGRENEK